MSTLVAIDDFGSAIAQSPFQTLQDKGLLQGVGELKINDFSAVPVNDDDRYIKPFSIRM